MGKTHEYWMMVTANAFGLSQPQPCDDGVMAIKIPGN